MNYGGIESCTLTDYPGQIACIIFTIGCNFRCPFCYNINLLSKDLFLQSKRKEISIEYILEYLKQNKKMLSGVVITGGEPLLDNSIVNDIIKIKKLGFLIKLDTNGSNPKLLQFLIKNKYIDYIAMDLKCPLKMYSSYTGYKNTDSILQSVALIKNSGLPHEFRLTLFSRLKKQDVIDTISLVRGETVYLQQFEPAYAYAPSARKLMPINRKIIDEIIEETKDVANVQLRGFS